MVLDLPTLMYATAASRLAFAIVFLLAWARDQAQDYNAWWATGATLTFLTMLTFVMQAPIDSVIENAVLTLMISSGFTCYWIGIRRFDGLPVPVGLVAFCGLLPVIAYSGVRIANGGDNLAATIRIAALLPSMVAGAFYLLCFGRAERLSSRNLAGAISIIYTMFYAVGVAWGLQSPAGSSLLGRGNTATLTTAVVDQLLGVIAYVSVIAMIGDRATRRLHQLTLIDPLTGLFNRRGLMVTVDTAFLADNVDRPISVIIADIDRFKGINDRFGHLAGDVVLTTYARQAAAAVRQVGDVVARYGGEEFVFVLPGSSLEHAMRRAEDLRALVSAAPVMLNGERIPVTASFGVSIVHPDETTIEAAIGRADDLLYTAKRTGRNKVIGDQTSLGGGDSARVVHSEPR